MISFGEYSISDWCNTELNSSRYVYINYELCLNIALSKVYYNRTICALYFRSVLDNCDHGNVNALRDSFRRKYNYFYGIKSMSTVPTFASIEAGKMNVDNFLLKFNKLKMFI